MLLLSDLATASLWSISYKPQQCTDYLPIVIVRRISSVLKPSGRCQAAEERVDEHRLAIGINGDIVNVEITSHMCQSVGFRSSNAPTWRSESRHVLMRRS